MKELTKREGEVYQLLARGLTDKQIGELLKISSQTVSVHTKHLFRKLGFNKRVQIVLAAQANKQQQA